MSYEQEDHYGFEVTPKWLQDEPERDEESDMPDLNNKKFDDDGKQRNGGVPCARGNGLLSEIPPPFQRFSEWKKNYTEPKFITGDELPVETDNVVWMDLPPIPKRRLVADTDWDSVEACRREAQAKLDRSQTRRWMVDTFWALLIVGFLGALVYWAARGIHALVVGL